MKSPYHAIRHMAEELWKAQCAARPLQDKVLLTDYRHLVKTEDGYSVWQDAFQAALREHHTLLIPPAEEPYWLSASVVVPSHRRIIADPKAVIRLTPQADVLMLRNEHVTDGTHLPEKEAQDQDIVIEGGHWEESRNRRMGYGASGKYDASHSKFGVSTCMLFAGVRGLTLRNMTFAHAAGFAVQMGNVEDVVCESISFEQCYADGLHLNGNSHRILFRNIHGQVGDDLVALNAYDWDTSSINFGPITDLLAEHLTLSDDSPYKAIRIQPGLYYYQDGSVVDCKIENIILSDVKGIKNFKLYLQTRPYPVNGSPARTGVGSGGNLYFENIDIHLDAPIDDFPNYRASDPITGWIAGFECGADLSLVSVKNVNLTVHPEFPSSALLLVGPKSSVGNGKEVFDPYITCHVERVVLENVSVNGKLITDPQTPFVHCVQFTNLYDSPLSSGRGTIGEIEVRDVGKIEA